MPSECPACARKTLKGQRGARYCHDCGWHEAATLKQLNALPADMRRVVVEAAYVLASIKEAGVPASVHERLDEAFSEANLNPYAVAFMEGA